MLINEPLDGQVYQRGLAGRAQVPVSGYSAQVSVWVRARLVGAQPFAGTSTDWVDMDLTEDHYFSGQLTAVGGTYTLEVKTSQGETASVPVGIGECFVVMGHSVAAGGAESLPGATAGMVKTIPELASIDYYARSGKAQLLPPPSFIDYADGVKPGPFGASTYFWAQFGEALAKREKVPVLVLNAAFGGTSLEHWAKAAMSIPFEHSFVDSTARMPYINLSNALTKYLSRTGCRAILSDQGQNDWPRTDETAVFADYQTVIEQARIDAGVPSLPVVVNRQTPFLNATVIRRVQERVIRDIPACYPGPDYDTGLLKADRYDDIHLAKSGMVKAAALWADAISPDFLARAQPWIRSGPAPAPVLTSLNPQLLVSRLSTPDGALQAAAGDAMVVNAALPPVDSGNRLARRLAIGLLTVGLLTAGWYAYKWARRANLLAWHMGYT